MHYTQNSSKQVGLPTTWRMQLTYMIQRYWQTDMEFRLYSCLRLLPVY